MTRACLHTSSLSPVSSVRSGCHSVSPMMHALPRGHAHVLPAAILCPLLRPFLIAILRSTRGAVHQKTRHKPPVPAAVVGLLLIALLVALLLWRRGKLRPSMLPSACCCLPDTEEYQKVNKGMGGSSNEASAAAVAGGAGAGGSAAVGGALAAGSRPRSLAVTDNSAVTAAGGYQALVSPRSIPSTRSAGHISRCACRLMARWLWMRRIGSWVPGPKGPWPLNVMP